MTRPAPLLLLALLLAGCGSDPAVDPAPAPTRRSDAVLPSPSMADPGRPGAPGVPHQDAGVARRGPVVTRDMVCVFDARPRFSFDGTVTDIGEGEVTFEVHESFRGDLPATYVVEMGGPEKSRASETGRSYSVGTRMLVVGARGEVWGCGRTVYYDEETAADRRSWSHATW